MSSNVSKWSLWWPVIVLALLPLGVSYFVYPDHLPPGFGVFPPQFQPPGAPTFSLIYFTVVALLGAAVLALYFFPKMFGFKGAEPEPAPQGADRFPWWFYAGGIIMLVSWFIMWSRYDSIKDIVPFAFTPLWWGFIVFLDGIVYKRAGSSFMSTKFGLMVICAIVSLVGWVFFEYFDYFVKESWYYPLAGPDSGIISHEMTVLVFLIAYTTVWPAVFEWYNLLNTFPAFVARYKNGWKLDLNGKACLIIGFVSMIGMVIWPFLLYWAVWIGPTLVFIGILKVANIKSPIDDLAKGNWAPALLIMLACYLNGFIWEFWNHGSVDACVYAFFNDYEAFLSTCTVAGSHDVSQLPNPLMNPNYWKYDIPYVNVIHIFSEMPILGYFGYMPFGILVWQFYIWAGNVFGFNSDITLKK